MKRFGVLLFFLFFCGCGDAKVTGTGNPCLPGTACSGAPDQPASAPASAEATVYRNDGAGVQALLPSGWIASEVALSVAQIQPGEKVLVQVMFTHQGLETKATMTVKQLAQAPASLQAYLGSLFSGRNFTSISTGNLQGLLFDDPTSGAKGGDLRIYFFLQGQTLMQVDADIQAGEEGVFSALLDGLSFTK